MAGSMCGMLLLSRLIWEQKECGPVSKNYWLCSLHPPLSKAVIYHLPCSVPNKNLSTFCAHGFGSAYIRTSRKVNVVSKSKGNPI